MNEMQDKELDDLFRKSLTQPEIPFESEAWKAMEAKLDADDNRMLYYRWIAASMVGVLLLVGSLWFVRSSFSNTLQESIGQHAVKQTHTTSLHDAGRQKKIVTSESNTVKNNATASSLQKVKEKTTAEQIPNDHKRVHIKEKENSPSTLNLSDNIQGELLASDDHTTARYEKNKKERILAIQQNSYKKSIVTSSSESLSTAEKEEALYRSRNKTVHEKQQDSSLASFISKEQTIKAVPSTINGLDNSSHNLYYNESLGTPIVVSDATLTKENPTTQNQLLLMPDGTANVIASPEIKGTEIRSSTTNTDTSPTTVSSPQTDESLVLSMDSTVISDSTVHTSATDVKELLTRSAFKRGFSLSLVVNPEFSSTTDFSFDKPGFNFGLYAEYYLSPRFSILAGVLYSKKVYSCNPYDYASAPSYNYWGQNYTADAVNAYCAVLDIPVNVRYKFLNRKSFNLYTVAGLSSYVMLKENYNFEYQMPYGTKDYSYEIDNKNRYFFNVGNISLGVEKYISNHWSVQAEPYVKIPFGGVGAGKIKLISTGMYFSVKYYFR